MRAMHISMQEREAAVVALEAKKVETKSKLSKERQGAMRAAEKAADRGGGDKEGTGARRLRSTLLRLL